ncbi:metallophosphoesterase [Larkinella sp. GY13]|uniref:metallophosphoesterase n=1 Tax=Larkinella sp. GY13 TaxID=3453720 RepID=UPI003EEF39BB
MKQPLRKPFGLALLAFTLLPVFAALAQPTPKTVLGDWWFWPDYTLERNARNYPGPRKESPTTPAVVAAVETPPLTFFGETPTERITNLLPAVALSGKAFAVELWLLNHVNEPVGALVTLRNRQRPEQGNWLLGCYGQTMLFSLKPDQLSQLPVGKKQPRGGTETTTRASILRTVQERGWKKRWSHLVGNYDGTGLQLYLNGKKIGEIPQTYLTASGTDSLQLEMAAYLRREPYMQWGDLVKNVRIHNVALTEQAIVGRFAELQQLVEDGRLYPDLFHFNAGPYLNGVQQESIRLVWETDRPASAVIRYGDRQPLSHTVTVPLSEGKTHNEGKVHSYIQEAMLKDLKPGTPYFYEIEAKSKTGETISSGIQTFSTAVKEGQAFTFGVIGDTEARPHVNNRVAGLLWDERPNFVLHVGDLTDGGEQPYKFEWNYEFFTGNRQLSGRVPFFPVPGNGEGDLYWYKQYHALPEPKAYYSFRYGDAEFFMLNSNEEKEFAPGGKQYGWLEEQLKKSTARWKFVAHHHAPYSPDEDDYGNAWTRSTDMGDVQIRKIIPLYEKYGVDLVFYGHLHTYHRTLPIREGKVNRKKGITYIQVGGAGGNLEDFAPTRPWFTAKAFRGYHYGTLTLADGHLNFKVYDTEGRLKDYLDLEKAGREKP